MEYEIPLFDLNFSKAEEDAVVRTMRSGWISMGPNCLQVEKEFATLLGVRNTIALTNCTAALHLSLLALDIGVGDEVIVPSMTFVATVNAIRYVGATPVFADICSKEDFGIDPVEIESLITAQTKAIMVMHYGGFAVDMERISKIATTRGIALIEDAAHAPGSEWAGKSLGTIGDVGCFSFFSNKNITCAEGGLLVTNRDDIAERVRLLRAHGMTSLSFERAKGHATKYDVVDLGYNYRLDDIRGALILEQLKKLGADQCRRTELRRIYIEELSGVDEITIPYKHYSQKCSNYIMPIVLKRGNAETRETIRDKLAKRGIQTSMHYPAVHRFSIYERYRRPLPITEMVADLEITLPMYPAMEGEQVEAVCRSLKDSCRIP